MHNNDVIEKGSTHLQTIPRICLSLVMLFVSLANNLVFGFRSLT